MLCYGNLIKVLPAMKQTSEKLTRKFPEPCFYNLATYWMKTAVGIGVKLYAFINQAFLTVSGNPVKVSKPYLETHITDAPL